MSVFINLFLGLAVEELGGVRMAQSASGSLENPLDPENLAGLTTLRFLRVINLY